MELMKHINRRVACPNADDPISSSFMQQNSRAAANRREGKEREGKEKKDNNRDGLFGHRE
jgi:hypothetical protein